MQGPRHLASSAPPFTVLLGTHSNCPSREVKVAVRTQDFQNDGGTKGIYPCIRQTSPKLVLALSSGRCCRKIKGERPMALFHALSMRKLGRFTQEENTPFVPCLIRGRSQLGVSLPQRGKGWERNRRVQFCELRSFTVRSHQTCISRDISPALSLQGWPAALKGLGLAPNPFNLSETLRCLSPFSADRAAT